MTALTTCPFLTFPSGAASFTLAVMTSPSSAYCPCDPPRRWMQEIFFAPELSATSRMVRIWIMTRSSLRLGCCALAALDDPPHPPALARRQRTGLHDLDRVPDLAVVGLVVGHELGLPPDVPLVELVPDDPVHAHDDRLVGLVRHDDPRLGRPPPDDVLRHDAFPSRSRRTVSSRASSLLASPILSGSVACPVPRCTFIFQIPARRSASSLAKVAGSMSRNFLSDFVRCDIVFRPTAPGARRTSS